MEVLYVDLDVQVTGPLPTLPGFLRRFYSELLCNNTMIDDFLDLNRTERYMFRAVRQCIQCTELRDERTF